MFTLEEPTNTPQDIFENLKTNDTSETKMELVQVEAPAVPSRLALGLGMKFSTINLVSETKNIVEENIKENAEENIEDLFDNTNNNQTFCLEEPNLNDITLEIHTKDNLTEQIEEIQTSEKNEKSIIFPADKKIILELEINEIPNEKIIENINTVQAEIDKIFEPTETIKDDIQIVEKTVQQMQDEYVTIKGITLNRKKGNRLLTDIELEAEANFELQKRALEERASKLRSMSFNVNKADIEDNQNNVPAYQRKNIALENHPNSNEDVYSNTTISNNGSIANISTLNSFLNGKNPD